MLSVMLEGNMDYIKYVEILDENDLTAEGLASLDIPKGQHSQTVLKVEKVYFHNKSCITLFSEHARW